MKVVSIAVLAVSVLVPLPAAAQGTIADYQRAMALRARYDGLALNVVDERQWIRDTNRFWYRRSVKGGHEFILVDADAKTLSAQLHQQRIAVNVRDGILRASLSFFNNEADLETLVRALP